MVQDQDKRKMGLNVLLPIFDIIIDKPLTFNDIQWGKMHET